MARGPSWNAFPVRCTRSRMSSSSNACNVARPATIASWFVLKVDECTTARSMELKTASDTAAEDSIGAHRHVPARECLGERDDVRGDPELLVAQEGSGPAHAGLDLVEHQQRLVATAERFRASDQNSSGARLTPLPWIGSMTRAATSPRRSPGRGRARRRMGSCRTREGADRTRLRNSRPPFNASAPVVSP